MMALQPGRSGFRPGGASPESRSACTIVSRVTVVLALYAGSGWGRAYSRALIYHLEPAEDGTVAAPSRTRAKLAPARTRGAARPGGESRCHASETPGSP